MLHTALTSIMAQFKDVNPYRWPGWSVTTLAAVMGISVMLFFTETRSLSRLKISNAKCSCLTGLKLSAQLRTKSIVQYLVSSFVAYHTRLIIIGEWEYASKLIFLRYNITIRLYSAIYLAIHTCMHSMNTKVILSTTCSFQ